MKRSVISLITIVLLLSGCVGSSPSDESYEDVLAQARQVIEATLAADSSVPELLNALEVSQQTDLTEYKQQLLDRIKIKLNMQLVDPGLCKKKLLEIIEVAESFSELSEIAEKANARLPNALVSCDGTAKESSVRYNYEFTSKPEYEIGVRKVKITASVTGTLKEWTVGGFSADGQDSFYFNNAQLTWSWDDYSESGCEVTTVKGSGTKQLTSSADGAFILFADGTYEGYLVDAEVPLTYSVRAKSAELIDDDGYPETPLVNPCGYVKEESHPETEHIEVHIEDKTGDMTQISGASRETEEYQEIGGTTLSEATWDLILPK
ncbi:MAG: hypothetical protein Q7S65_06100 [Nanoarchaeota archaeon]|nr:hypothetical protein [Nanoarchaeota archaeon]